MSMTESSKRSNRSKKSSQLKKKSVEGIKKQYLKAGDVCNVTFRLPKEAAPDAEKVTLVGEFNNWSLDDTPMQKLKNGSFKKTVKLLRGHAYRFRYFIDSCRWENDWCADEYTPNAFGCDDSVVRI